VADPVRADVSGVEDLLRVLGRYAQRAGRTAASVSVIYDSPYGIFVHERLDVHHPTGQAKFLEQPARQKTREMAAATALAWRAGRTWPEAIRAAAEVLLEASQELVPVDTGALRASGKVVEGGP